MDRIDATTVFESRRGFLMGLAYRILGSRSEAEDVVQDLFIKWLEADQAAIATPAAWLTTACTRQCIDLLRSAQRSRLEYVGTWLPEPIHTLHHDSPEQSHELASSLSTAFLLLLERLTPRERAAYLLYAIFDLDYPEVAQTLGVQETTCRKLVSRAKSRLGNAQVRYPPEPSRQEQLLSAFHAAIASGSTESLAALLSEDVELCADGGGKASAIRETLYGVDAVSAFVGESLSLYWRDYQWQEVEINGRRGVVLRGEGAVVAVVSFGYDGSGRVDRVFIVRNPEKLAGVGGGLLV